MRTLFAREFSEKVCNLDEMLEIFRCELEAKKQASLTAKAEKVMKKVERTTPPVLYDVILRFRLGSIGIIANIRQAFLQISVDPTHRDYLRFLWTNFDSNDQDFYIY